MSWLTLCTLCKLVTSNLLRLLQVQTPSITASSTSSAFSPNAVPAAAQKVPLLSSRIVKAPATSVQPVKALQPAGVPHAAGDMLLVTTAATSLTAARGSAAMHSSTAVPSPVLPPHLAAISPADAGPLTRQDIPPSRVLTSDTATVTTADSRALLAAALSAAAASAAASAEQHTLPAAEAPIVQSGVADISKHMLQGAQATASKQAGVVAEGYDRQASRLAFTASKITATRQPVTITPAAAATAAGLRHGVSDTSSPKPAAGVTPAVKPHTAAAESAAVPAVSAEIPTTVREGTAQLTSPQISAAGQTFRQPLITTAAAGAHVTAAADATEGAGAKQTAVAVTSPAEAARAATAPDAASVLKFTSSSQQVSQQVRQPMVKTAAIGVKTAAVIYAATSATAKEETTGMTAPAEPVKAATAPNAASGVNVRLSSQQEPASAQASPLRQPTAEMDSATGAIPPAVQHYSLTAVASADRPLRMAAAAASNARLPAAIDSLAPRATSTLPRGEPTVAPRQLQSGVLPTAGGVVFAPRQSQNASTAASRHAEADTAEAKAAQTPVVSHTANAKQSAKRTSADIQVAVPQAMPATVDEALASLSPLNMPAVLQYPSSNAQESSVPFATAVQRVQSKPVNAVRLPELPSLGVQTSSLHKPNAQQAQHVQHAANADLATGAEHLSLEHAALPQALVEHAPKQQQRAQQQHAQQPKHVQQQQHAQQHVQQHTQQPQHAQQPQHHGQHQQQSLSAEAATEAGVDNGAASSTHHLPGRSEPWGQSNSSKAPVPKLNLAQVGPACAQHLLGSRMSCICWGAATSHLLKLCRDELCCLKQAV